MSRLLLCVGEQAKKPFYIKEEGIKISSAEELSYYIYNNLFLLSDDFVDEALLQFIGGQLNLKNLELKLRKQMENRSQTQLLVTILQEIHYYGSEEIIQFERQTEQKMLAKPNELTMRKAELLLNKKRYRHAIELYDHLLNDRQKTEWPDTFIGEVWHQKARAKAGLFLFAQAAECLVSAYSYLKSEVVLKQIYILGLLDNGCSPDQELLDQMDQEQKYQWKEEVEQIRKEFINRTDYSAIVNPGETLEEWKKEYRKMVL